MEAATMDEKEKAPARRAADRVVRTPKKRGRPTRYSPKVLEAAERMAKSGATLEEIARAVGELPEKIYTAGRLAMTNLATS